MRNLATLQQYFEACFKQEGLYDVVPADRRESLLTFPIASAWFFLLWFIQIYFVLRNTNYEGWIAALLFTPLLLLASFILLLVFFFVRHFRELMDGKQFDKLVSTSIIGGFFLLIFPFILVVATGLYLRSFLVPIYQLGLSVVGLICFLILYSQRFRVHLFIEFIRTAFKVLARSVALILVLLPVLLVIVLLSVFSEDLWAVLGNLSLLRIIGGTLLLALPAVLLMLAVLNKTAIRILGDLPDSNEIIERTISYPLLQKKLEGGFISDEEWADAKDELGWRDKPKLSENLLPIIRRKIKHWLALLLILTSILVTLTFLLYFCLLFRTLLEPNVIAKWVDVPLEVAVYTVSLFGYSMNISRYSTDIPIAKVSLLLSVFIALASNVYYLTDESASGRLTGWLTDKARTWLSLSYMYDGIICPGYQIWRFVRKDMRRGLVNVFIVVPRGSTDEAVERACEHLEARLNSFRTLVHITAYEQSPENPIYESWISGRRWQLMHNKINGYRGFDTMHITDEEIRSQCFLGRDYLESGKAIPDEWFGNDSSAVSISRNIWETDGEHSLILHPYTLITETGIFLDIRLKKRMSQSDQYRQYLKGLMKLILEKKPDASNISITLTFRDTGDTLASAWWHKQVPYVSYRDEVVRKTLNEKIASWDLA